MLLKEIRNNEKLVEKWNNTTLQLRNEIKGFNGKTINSVYDKIVPYSMFIKQFKDEFSNSNVIKDNGNNFSGIYIAIDEHVFSLLTGYKINRYLFEDLKRDMLFNHKNEKYFSLVCKGDYGVCDNATQVINLYNQLNSNGYLDKNKTYVILLRPIIRELEPKRDGWRWHKWGYYIGTQDSQCEYIVDEDDIDLVFCYRIVEVIK